jgi:hypothetical protein
MLTRIIHHEWRAIRAGRTLRIIVPLFAVIIGYGVYNGASWLRFQQTTLRAAADEERDPQLRDGHTRIEQERQTWPHYCQTVILVARTLKPVRPTDAAAGSGVLRGRARDRPRFRRLGGPRRMRLSWSAVPRAQPSRVGIL